MNNTNSSVSQRKGGHELARSMLSSYKLYENVLLKKDNEQVRKALLRNYYFYISGYYPNYLDLIELAKSYVENLGIKEPIQAGGKNFVKISNVIGFENTLYLKKILVTTQNYILLKINKIIFFFKSK